MDTSTPATKVADPAPNAASPSTTVSPSTTAGPSKAAAIKTSVPTTTGAITDDKRWRHGDAVLVSSDNVRFCVPSFYLLAASSVFRDGQGLAVGSIQLELTDFELETAQMLRHFLYLVTANSLDMSIHDVSPDDCHDHGSRAVHVGRRLVNLIRLLRKCDCEGHMRRVGDWAWKEGRERDEDRSRLPAFSVFMVGAELERLDLCQLALQRKHALWSVGPAVRDPLRRMNSGMQAHHYLNPAGMTLEMYDAIPNDYRFALSRAWMGRKPDADVSEAFGKALDSVMRSRRRKRKMTAAAVTGSVKRSKAQT